MIFISILFLIILVISILSVSYEDYEATITSHKDISYITLVSKKASELMNNRLTVSLNVFLSYFLKTACSLITLYLFFSSEEILIDRNVLIITITFLVFSLRLLNFYNMNSKLDYSKLISIFLYCFTLLFSLISLNRSIIEANKLVVTISLFYVLPLIALLDILTKTKYSNTKKNFRVLDKIVMNLYVSSICLYVSSLYDYKYNQLIFLFFALCIYQILNIRIIKIFGNFYVYQLRNLILTLSVIPYFIYLLSRGVV